MNKHPSIHLTVLLLLSFFLVFQCSEEKKELTVSANPPASEGPFSAATEIELSTSEDDATIYYSTDGEDPSADSLKYEEPLTLSENTTLKFYAVATVKKEGMFEDEEEEELESEIETEEYEFSLSGTGTGTTIGTTPSSGSDNTNNNSNTNFEVEITSSESTLTATSPFSITVTFANEVTGFTLDDLEVSGGSATSMTEESAKVYTVLITPSTDPVTVKVKIPADSATDEDGASNSASGEFTIAYDTSYLTGSITSTESGATTSSSFTITITFSETVSGFTAEDFTLTNGSVSNLATTDNKVFTATLTPTSAGTVSASIAQDKVVDATTGKKSNESVTAFTIVYDTTAPTLGASGALTFTNVELTTLTLNWTKASDNYDGATSLKYKVVQSTSNNISSLTDAETTGSGRTVVLDWTADINTVSVTSLTPLTTYYFNVLVKDSLGNKSIYTMNSQQSAGWIAEAYLKAPNAGDWDNFGLSVDISGDTVVVGTYKEDSNTLAVINGADLTAANDSGSESGAVYVFVRSGSTWTHQAYLKPPNLSDGDWFGSSVAISGDTIVVGGEREASNTTAIINDSDLSGTNDTGTKVGAAYVFVRSGTTWSFQSYLKAPNPSDNDYFGKTVDISGDTIVVGSDTEDSDTQAIINGNDLSSTNNDGSNAGAVYVFKRTGTNWALEAYLKGSNTEAGDYFGSMLAIDGDTVVSGAWAEKGNSTAVINGSDLSAANNSGNQVGAVYVFKRSGTTWTQEAYLKPPNPTNGDYFGEGLDIDGDTVIVGAPSEDSSTTSIINGSDLSSTDDSAGASGAAYIFVRNGSTWSFQSYLKAPNGYNGDGFGDGVKVDGDTIVVSAYSEDSDTNSIIHSSDLTGTDNDAGTSGALYVYKRSSNAWSFEAYIKTPNSGSSDQLGLNFLGLDNGTIVAGAYSEDSDTQSIINGSDLSATNDDGNEPGAVYIFDK